MSSRPGFRLLWRVGRIVVSGDLLVLIAAGMLGRAVGDRSVVLALCLYVPLPLLGLAAVGLDLLTWGRMVPRARWLLGGVGLVAILVGTLPLVGFGPDGPEPGGPDAISVVQWNVQWGGGQPYNPDRWAPLRQRIADQRADLVILSETPGRAALDEMVGALGPGAARVERVVLREQPIYYLCRVAVASRWPIRELGPVEVANGAAVGVEVMVRGKPLRALVVDGLSRPTVHRGPFLADVARACDAARQAGEPYDLIAGDFNCMSRSQGFAGLERLGYRLAGRSARGWRGTFPAVLPLYDIDHVWVRNDVDGLRCRFLRDSGTDHRGQLVRFLRPY